MGLIGRPAMRDLDDVRSIGDDSFRPEESGRKFGIMTRRAHRDGDGLPSDSDFQRFFPGENIPSADRSSRGPNPNRRGRGYLRVGHQG